MSKGINIIGEAKLAEYARACIIGFTAIGYCPILTDEIARIGVQGFATSYVSGEYAGEPLGDLVKYTPTDSKTIIEKYQIGVNAVVSDTHPNVSTYILPKFEGKSCSIRAKIYFFIKEEIKFDLFDLTN